MADHGNTQRRCNTPVVVMAVVISVVILVVFTSTLIALLHQARLVAQHSAYTVNLKGMHVAMYRYSVGNNGSYPTHIGMLLADGSLTPEYLTITNYRTSLPEYPGDTPPSPMYRYGDYFFTYTGLDANASPEHILAFSMPLETDLIHVMFADGQVSSLTYEELQAAITRSNELRSQEDPPIPSIEIPSDITNIVNQH